jgi:hypothetical protein
MPRPYYPTLTEALADCDLPDERHVARLNAALEVLHSAHAAASMLALVFEMAENYGLSLIDKGARSAFYGHVATEAATVVELLEVARGAVSAESDLHLAASREAAPAVPVAA